MPDYRDIDALGMRPMVDRTLKVLEGRGVKVPDAVLKPIEPGYYDEHAAVEARWRADDDGSAAHEPKSCDGWKAEDFTSSATASPEVLARLAGQAEQIGALQCRIGQLEREKKGVEDAIDSIVRADKATIAQLEREKEALRENRDHWLGVAADLAARLLPAGPHEDPAIFPLNALKHSR